MSYVSRSRYQRDYRRNMTILRNNSLSKEDIKVSLENRSRTMPEISEEFGQLSTQRRDSIVIGNFRSKIKNMHVDQKVKQFINKLKRSQYANGMPKDIEEEEKDLEQSAQQFQVIEKEAKAKTINGYVLNKELKLLISLLNFLTIVYIQIISSFHCFLPEFRHQFSSQTWVAASEYVCIAVIIIKIICQMVVQKTVYGYRLVSLQKIILYYILSLEFILDSAYLIAILLLIQRNFELYPSILAYVASLIRLSLVDRIDELICNHLMIGNAKRQYLALVRLLLANLFLAHLIGTIFLAMANFSPEHNWMLSYSIDQYQWPSKYVYSVYWAVTIIFTCGFGDILVSNTSQAVVVTLVMIFGCLILSYNISQVGAIFYNLQHAQEKLRKELLLLRKIAHISKISNKLHQSMADYLIHSSQVKFQYELEESRNLIMKLPENLRSEYMEQNSTIFFSQMPILALLRSQTKKLLVERLSYEILSPEECITHKRLGLQKVYMLRMGKVKLGYKKRGSQLNGLVLQTAAVKEIQTNNPLLLNAFLFNRAKKENYSIICDNFCDVAHLEFKDLYSSLKECQPDYEFVKQFYDSQQALEEQWAFRNCQYCSEKHSLFSCPKLIYMPLRSVIYLKLTFQKRQRNGLLSAQSWTVFEQYKQRYFMYIRQLKYRHAMKSSLKYWTKIFEPLEKLLSINLQKQAVGIVQPGRRRISKPQSRLFHTRNKQSRMMQLQQREMEVDVPWDFDNYFRKHNPKNLVEKKVQLRKAYKYIPLLSSF